MLQAQHLTKTFGPLAAVADISFNLPAGQTLAILGPSGCGKSTLLALIAGLVRPDSGSVLWEGQLLDDTPTHQRNFGLMFQDYALFPHLNVADNVAFGLHGPDKHRAVANMLARLDLAGFEKRDVQTLSGGEAQRVALARALVVAASVGLTSLQTFEGPEVFGALQRLRARGALPLRVCCHLRRESLPDALRLGIRTGFGEGKGDRPPQVPSGAGHQGNFIPEFELIYRGHFESS